MKFQKTVALFVLGVQFFTSCTSHDDLGQPENETKHYDNGFFIMNEGNYGVGNASVSFLDNSESTITHQIFKKENNGNALGDTGQNMAFYKDYAFMVMNVSNSLVVVDRYSFKHLITIEENLNNPRFITFSEGKAFVTNWGDGMNPDDDFVSVFNADTFASLGKIPVAEGPERILAAAGKVFVAHAGGFNLNDKISVIDAVKNEISTTISVGIQPNSMAVDEGVLWVLSGGTPFYLENESAGNLLAIDMATLQINRELTFSKATDHPANLQFENDVLYYTLGNEVYSLKSSENSLPETADFEMAGVEVLYGFKVYDSKIYAASANFDFSSDGKLIVYDLQGNILKNFSTGVNPNGIYFNE